MTFGPSCMWHAHNSPVYGYLNLQGLEVLKPSISPRSDFFGLMHFWFMKFPYNPIHLLYMQQ